MVVARIGKIGSRAPAANTPSTMLLMKPSDRSTCRILHSMYPNTQLDTPVNHLQTNRKANAIMPGSNSGPTITRVVRIGTDIARNWSMSQFASCIFFSTHCIPSTPSSEAVLPSATTMAWALSSGVFRERYRSRTRIGET